MTEKLTYEESYRQGLIAMAANDTIVLHAHPRRAMEDEIQNEGLPAFLKEWRAYRRMKQQQVADELGTTVPTVSRRETGARGVPITELRQYAKVYRCQPSALLKLPEFSEIDDLIEKMNAGTRKRAKRMLELMVEEAASAPDAPEK